MKILYLGEHHGTSGHRAAALGRLGHQVEILDPIQLLPWPTLHLRLNNHLPIDVLDRLLARKLRHRLPSGCELAWVNQGTYLGPRCLEAVRRAVPLVVNYANDNPFCAAGLRRFRAYRQALPLYDHVFLPREENVQEALRLGVPKAYVFMFTADEVAHRPVPLDDPGLAPWRGHLGFAGTWFPERGPFLCRLLDLGVKIRLAGDRWERAAEWPRLRQHHLGHGLTGADYVRCLQGSLASLCLLNAANLDLHTRRTAEIPAVGGVLIAPRTPAHARMFVEGEEALLFDGAEEAARHMALLAADPARRAAIAAAGRRRVVEDGRLNEPELRRLLALASGSTQP